MRSIPSTPARLLNSNALCARPGRGQRILRLLSPLAQSHVRGVVPLTGIKARRYAQGPGGGAGGPGGFSFSGFKPQHQKGEALKEYVSQNNSRITFPDKLIASDHKEYRPHTTGKRRKAGSCYWKG